MHFEAIFRVEALVRCNQLRHLVDRHVAQRYVNPGRLSDTGRGHHRCPGQQHEYEPTHGYLLFALTMRKRQADKPTWPAPDNFTDISAAWIFSLSAAFNEAATTASHLRTGCR